MSQCVVPAIVLVTLTIMFGSSFLARRHEAELRRTASSVTQLAGRGDLPATTKNVPRPNGGKF